MFDCECLNVVTEGVRVLRPDGEGEVSQDLRCEWDGQHNTTQRPHRS